MTKTVESTQPPVEMLDAGDARPWPVKVLTLLFFVQALGLFGLSVLNFDQAVLPEGGDFLQMVLTTLIDLNRTMAFGTLGLLAVVASFGFLWLGRTGWQTGMLVQGLGLLVAIGLYLRDGPVYVFGIMSYCILMVIYLHHPDVQQAFQTKRGQETKMDEAV